MKRCFAYIRVSTVKQGDGVSLEAQQEAILNFASRHDLQIVQWFEEKQTAAKSGRPTFNKMISELRRGRAQGLIIHKIDRSARNLGDWARIGELADGGIDIHFVTESLDFRSRGGRLAADVQAVVAADYVRNLREECIKGINGRLKQGLYPFRAPIGYIDNGKGKPKTPDPLRAPLVKRAFELYAVRGHSLRSLLLELRRLGLTNRENGKLTLGGLETILNSPFYCGIIHIKRTGMTYKGVHQRLISPHLFEQVQAVKSGKSGPKMTRHAHVYRGLFRCGLCRGPMIPERQKGHVYYRCQKQNCDTKTVREDALAVAINECLENAQLSENDVAAVHVQIDQWVTEVAHPEVDKALALREANLEDRIGRLTDALIDRLIDKEQFGERRRKLALEEEVLTQERADRQNRSAKARNLLTLLELTKTLKSSHELAHPDQKRGIIEITSSNRVVTGKKIYLEPQKWLVDLKEGQPVLSGAPGPGRDRTFIENLNMQMTNPQLAKFISKELPAPTNNHDHRFGGTFR